MITLGSMDCNIHGTHFVGKSQCFIIVKNFQSCFQFGNQKGIIKLKLEGLHFKFQTSALLSAIFSPLLWGSQHFDGQIYTAGVTG